MPALFLNSATLGSATLSLAYSGLFGHRISETLRNLSGSLVLAKLGPRMGCPLSSSVPSLIQSGHYWWDG